MIRREWAMKRGVFYLLVAAAIVLVAVCLARSRWVAVQYHAACIYYHGGSVTRGTKANTMLFVKLGTTNVPQKLSRCVTHIDNLSRDHHIRLDLNDSDISNQDLAQLSVIQGPLTIEVHHTRVNSKALEILAPVPMLYGLLGDDAQFDQERLAQFWAERLRQRPENRREK